MLDKLIEISHHFLKIKNSSYKRYLIKKTQFNHRMSIFLGQRGVGKTTMLVQLLLNLVEQNRFDHRILYVQADHFVMGGYSLYEIAEQFHLMGGKWLAIDEIHKYPNWSKELKSIYDTFNQLTLFISGSSALEIYKGTHDLIRRSVTYKMQGLSFKEYLELRHSLEFPSYSFDEICKHHLIISEKILSQLESISLKIIPEFQFYLKYGYYPYYFEINDVDAYRITLEQNFHLTIDLDLIAIHPHINGISEKKIKKLLSFIAQSVPFTPNWNKLLAILEIGDSRTLKSYVSYLEDGGLIRTLCKASKKISRLESADKIYLDNTNQLFSICSQVPDKETIRETFFATMASENHSIFLPGEGDFSIDGNYFFEIGGKNKDFSQLKDKTNAYLALDDIEIGYKNKIPLWLFGFLY